MGKIKEILINTFDRGMSNDLRSKDNRKFALASHFDAFSFPHKLVPRPGFATNTGTSTDIVKTLYVSRGTSFDLIGLDKNANNRCYIKYWNGTAWATRANMESASETRLETVLFEYKKFAYMFGDNYLKRADTYDSSTAFVDNLMTTWTKSALPTITSLAQPILHPTDDIAYFFINNLVYSLDAPDDGGDGWALGLTLPDDLKIVQGFAYGNFLAIACTTKASITQGAYSVVYLWDRDSSLTTVTERIDFGSGAIKHIALLDNELVAVMDTEDDKKIVIKKRYYNGSKIIGRIELDDQQVHYAISQVINNKLYFPMKAPFESDNRLGVWVVDSNGNYNLDTVVPAFTTFDGIYWTGGKWWFCGGGVVKASSTTISATSIYKSLIFNGGDSSKTKQLIRVSILTAPLIATYNDITVEYITDASAAFYANTGWTKIMDTVGTRFKTVHEAINIESDGSAFLTFKEIKVRVTVANRRIEITGLKIKYEEVDDDLC